MPVEIRSLEQASLTVIIYREAISQDDLAFVLAAATADLYDRTCDEIVILESQVSIEVDVADLVDAARRFSALASTRRSTRRKRSAVLAGEAEDHPLVQAWPTFFPENDEARTDYRFFRTLEDAAAWLGLEAAPDVASSRIVVSNTSAADGA